MASLRQLNRRLRVWQRYDDRYNQPGDYLLAWRPFKPARGHYRIADRIANEQIRRGWWDDRPDCSCAGCVGMGPCDDDAGHGDTWVDELADEDDAFERGLL